MTRVQRCTHLVNSLQLSLQFNLITIQPLLQFSSVNGRLDKVQIALSHHSHITRLFIVSVRWRKKQSLLTTFVTTSWHFSKFTMTFSEPVPSVRGPTWSLCDFFFSCLKIESGKTVFQLQWRFGMTQQRVWPKNTCRLLRVLSSVSVLGFYIFF